MKACKQAIWGLSILAAVCAAAPEAGAQSVNKKAMSKATWFHAPHEIQIVDESPVVKDFREAPTAPESIQLPPAPQGFGAPGGGGGAGAMGDGGGPTLPAGGMQIPGNGPGYRTNTPGMGNLSLPKSGFGRFSNIPAGGMAPKTMLPSGQTTGVHGSLMTPTAHSAPAGAAAGAGNRAGMAPARAATPVASYGNYTHPTGGSSMGGGGASANVSGKLLNRLMKH